MNLTAACAPGFALSPCSRKEGALSGGGYTGRSSSLSEAFLSPRCLALLLFCRAEASGQEKSGWREFS